MYILGGLVSCTVTKQYFVNHTSCYQAKNPYTIIADKEITFCTIFVNGHLRIAEVYPKSRPSNKIVGLEVDIWGNKMKLRSTRAIRGTPIYAIQHSSCATTDIPGIY